MRPSGYRSFRFSPAECSSSRGLRVKVLAADAGMWWRILLTCGHADRRWALAQVGLDATSRRMPALALEHRAARRAGRSPDPEVDAVRAGALWRTILLAFRALFVAVPAAVFAVGAAVIVTMLLAALGLVDFEVSTR